MQPPTTIKEVQRLTSGLAALCRYLSKSTGRSLPFFEVIKRREGFLWTAECQEAFGDLKKYLLSLPLLSKLEAGETLFLYRLASQRAVAPALVWEECKVQHPVYYVGRALKDVEAIYTPLEKVIFALVTTMRNLVSYFQGHPVQVLTDHLLASVLRSPFSIEWMVKWAMELT